MRYTCFQALLVTLYARQTILQSILSLLQHTRCKLGIPDGSRGCHKLTSTEFEEDKTGCLPQTTSFTAFGIDVVAYGPVLAPSTVHVESHLPKAASSWPDLLGQAIVTETRDGHLAFRTAALCTRTSACCPLQKTYHATSANGPSMFHLSSCTNGLSRAHTNQPRTPDNQSCRQGCLRERVYPSDTPHPSLHACSSFLHNPPADRIICIITLLHCPRSVSTLTPLSLLSHSFSHIHSVTLSLTLLLHQLSSQS
jgi:hypothetical protein